MGSCGLDTEVDGRMLKNSTDKFSENSDGFDKYGNCELMP